LTREDKQPFSASFTVTSPVPRRTSTPKRATALGTDDVQTQHGDKDDIYPLDDGDDHEV
jgi:hypothetical protein